MPRHSPLCSDDYDEPEYRSFEGCHYWSECPTTTWRTSGIWRHRYDGNRTWSYLYAFNQQLMGCWNTTNYGGRHTVDNNEMTHVWRLYILQLSRMWLMQKVVRIMMPQKRISMLHCACTALIWCLSSLISTETQFIQRGRHGLHQWNRYAEVWQTGGYIQWFLRPVGHSSDSVWRIKPKITGDVIYKGDIAKWKKFANFYVCVMPYVSLMWLLNLPN